MSVPPPCQVLSFYIHEFMFEVKESKGQEQSVFPRDNDMQFIPEFTVIDLRIMTSHNAVEGGYGCKLQQITLHPTSLYSYVGPESLPLIPGSLQSSLELADQRVKESSFIGSQLELKNVAFFSQIPAGAFVSSTPVYEGTYRMVGKDSGELLPGVPCVDIAEEDLFRFTNSYRNDVEDVLDAITFLDFASSAGALSMYIVNQQAYKSGDPLQGDFKGVPLIDSEKFLSGVDFSSYIPVPGRGARVNDELEDGEEDEDEREVSLPRASFPFGFEVAGLSDNLSISVFINPISNPKVEAGGKFQARKDCVALVTGLASLGVLSAPAQLPPPPPCPDFALMSDKFFIRRGYVVTVQEADSPGSEILRMVFNALGSQSYSKGGVERVDYKARAEKRKARDEAD